MSYKRALTDALKPHISLVGAGNFASALAESLREAGYVIDRIVSRDRATSIRRAQILGREVGASAVAIGSARVDSEIVWLCVPDGEIRNAAQKLAAAGDWKGKVALHSSGALASDELSVLRERGASVASVHPLMTFVRHSRPPLAGVPFVLEGSRKAVTAARAVISHLHGQPFAIRKQQKRLYHAWGTFASPLLTALLAAGEDVAAGAGINRKAARERMVPILRQTLDNYARFGAPDSFSGPIARGDVATVRKHLAALREVPGAREIYAALARMALKNLPSRNRGALQKILKA